MLWKYIKNFGDLPFSKDKIIFSVPRTYFIKNNYIKFNSAKFILKLMFSHIQITKK